LRGIEKFTDAEEVTLIGDLPKCCKNITHIPFNDDPETGFRSRNIYNKIMTVDYDFLFFNDDHFLMAPFSPDTYHYSGTLMGELGRPNLSDPYRKTIRNTIEVFGDIKNFDTHCPVAYKKEILNKIDLDWTRAQGYCIKSVYAHLAGIEGTEYPDLKIRNTLPDSEIKKLIRGRQYFSTDNYAVNSAMVRVLEEIYPNKSIYES